MSQNLAELQEKDFEEEKIFALADCLGEIFGIKNARSLVHYQETVMDKTHDYKTPLRQVRKFFTVESDNANFKILFSQLIHGHHESAPKAYLLPRTDLTFSFAHGSIFDHRWHYNNIISALKNPDQELAKSLEVLKQITSEIPYLVCDKIFSTNFEKAGEKFFLSLEPTARTMADTLCLGFNIVSDEITLNLIKTYFANNGRPPKNCQRMMQEWPFEAGVKIEGANMLSLFKQLLELSDKDFITEKNAALMALQDKPRTHWA